MKKIMAVLIMISMISTSFVACMSYEPNSQDTSEDTTEMELISLDAPLEVTIDGQTLSMDEYVAGVVAAELQGWFQLETCRVFAIAARTNAVKRINSGKELINSTAFQCFYSKEEMKEIYGDNFENYYQKFFEAATSTHNMVIVDSTDKLIDALYHALSSGKTEDSKFVTGYDVSYLRSVQSPWDKECTDYKRVRFISYDKLSELGFVNPKFSVVSYTDSGSSYVYEVCGEKYTATDLMYKLKLRSATFDVNYKSDGIEFTTYGFGHGMGISAYGAEGMAKEGYVYQEIISHYYTGIRIVRY